MGGDGETVTEVRFLSLSIAIRATHLKLSSLAVKELEENDVHSLFL
jgi:hypothetical protein